MIVVNTTFRMCPWADVVYGMDMLWWKSHLKEIRESFRGEKIAPIAAPGARRVQFRRCGNSGAGAIALADFSGAERIGLLGYDCQHTGGKKHWHGDHPEGSGAGNAGSVHKWPKQFRSVAETIRAEVVNLTRETALDVWPRGDLEAFLDS